MAELALRFLVIGAIAFGGGQAALPLVERLAVADTGWLSASQFAAGVGLAYATPGPVLILAAYVGYVAFGLPGALAASAAVFAIPVALAAAAASLVARLQGAAWFGRFGGGAAAAAIGLLGVTLFVLARPLVEVQPLLLLGALVVFVAARRISPVLILVVAAGIGALLGWLV